MTTSSEIKQLNNENAVFTQPSKDRNAVYLSSVKNTRVPAYLSNYSIKFCSTGVERYCVNGRRFDLNANQYLFVNKDQRVEFFTDELAEGLSIFLKEDLLQDVFSSIATSDHNLLSGRREKMPVDFYAGSIHSCDVLSQWLKKLYERMKFVDHDKSSFEELDYYNLAEHFINAQLRINKQINSIEKARRTTREEIFSRINIALEFMHAHFDARFDLDTVSKVACLSKFHFLRCFKQLTGYTPYQYHHQLRMEYAKSQIQSGKRSVKELSIELDFSEISAFSNSYHSYYGRYPSEDYV